MSVKVMEKGSPPTAADDVKEDVDVGGQSAPRTGGVEVLDARLQLRLRQSISGMLRQS